MRLTLRARLIAICLVGLAVTIGVGGVVLYGALRFSGLRTLDHSAAETAAQVVQLMQTHRLPDPIPVTGDQIVQVLDSRERVVSASVNADRLTALLASAEVTRALDSPVVVSGSRDGLSGELRVSAVRVDDTGDTVVVAQRLDEIERSTRVLGKAMLLTFPVLLALLALIAWRVIGATLRPVEGLRSGAERISGAGHDERLPVPSSADEVQALALTLNSMLDRLADSRERQRAFVGDVAHELRSPLTSIRTQLEIAQQMGEGGGLVDDLHTDVMRMSALVEDLLTLARLDADEAAPPVAEPVDLMDLFGEVAARYGDRRVPVEVRSTTTPVLVVADRGDLDRVLTNLVDNAQRHAERRIEFSAVRSGHRVILRADDDGPGIAVPDRERALERFTRLDQARDRDTGGTGLGLAIVAALAARNGGAVRLGDSPLGGLRVEVTLRA